MASIRKRRLPSGNTSYICDYVDQSGKRRAKSFKTKKAANDWLTRTKFEILQGVHTPESGSITVAEAAEIWLRRCEADGLEFTTIEDYLRLTKRHLIPEIGRVKLASINRPFVHQFVEQLLNTRSQDLTRRIVATLGRVLSDCERRGLVAQNAVRGSRFPSLKRQKPKLQWPSKAELNLMINGADERWRPLLLVGIFAGLRASEIRGLSWSSVDLENGQISVMQRADRHGQIGPPKSAAGFRTIPLAPVATNSLREWRLRSPETKLGLVFPNRNGRPECLSNLRSRFFHPLQCDLGIVHRIRQPDGTVKERPKFGFHSLRHAAASLWIEGGFSPAQLKELMGHSSIQLVFDTYGYLFRDDAADKAMMKQIQVRLLG